MTLMRFTFPALRSTLFWLSLAALSLFTLFRVSEEYLGTISSFQDFRWRVAGFVLPSADATQTSLTLEVQNKSGLDLDFKDLEIYLWLNDKTVGKTYGRFETRTVAAHGAAHIPLTIQLDGTELRAALAQGKAEPAWSVTGSYKVNAPFAPADFLYRLRLTLSS